MANTEKIRDIFSILHDGVIVSWTGDKKLLTLKIGCQYLAKRIDPSFDFFFINLIDIDRLVLVPWMNPVELEQEYLTELNDIFEAELDLLSAEIENNTVKISCNQSNPGFDYCGGTLYLSCQAIQVFDQDKNELTMDTLDAICREYWDDFARRE